MPLISIIMSTIFIMISHPTLMISILMIQSFITSIHLSKLTKNFWPFYMFLIIIIGGLMIMFVYMCSITPNTKISTNKITKLTFLTSMMILPPMILITNNSSFPINSNTSPNKMMFKLSTNLPSMLALIMVTLLLLISMLINMKISQTFKSPIRSI